MTTLDPIAFSPDGETWLEYGPDRTRIGFHDYEAIYAVPGLYERVFYEELQMCSSERVPALWARALADLGRDVAQERVLDVGAGNGIGGEALRGHGVPHLVGLDLEPHAKVAAERDRPGVYDDYLVADLTALTPEQEAALEGHGFTSVLALAAIGIGHVPVHAVERALALLEPGGVFAFAVNEVLLPGTEDPDGLATGYPEFLGGLLGDELARETYVHRRMTDGTGHDAIAIVGRV